MKMRPEDGRNLEDRRTARFHSTASRPLNPPPWRALAARVQKGPPARLRNSGGATEAARASARGEMLPASLPSINCWRYGLRRPGGLAGHSASLRSFGGGQAQHLANLTLRAAIDFWQCTA